MQYVPAGGSAGFEQRGTAGKTAARDGFTAISGTHQGDTMDGCTTLDTLTTVCSSTPPLPPTGSTGSTLAAALVAFVVGFVVTFTAGRR